ncbi:Aconitate hydratase family protein [uncultured Desulfobacterium sp.]|uniref:Aconitate hydratase A n=1 Tax=uncultured Desulfobacterium sp. TaxID=201089 RepID=A0A445MZ15_9BACT|nr:Aconitate hydratase family protein [uncultured Desulfobacterium sp.]
MNRAFDPSTATDILDKKRRLLGRGLSYSEKILFLHEENGSKNSLPVRGKDQIRLFPDRVIMQDATAQMTMLQFIQTGFVKTRVPATIHCDHLLRAGKGAGRDLEDGLIANREIYEFLSSSAAKYGLGFWRPGSGIMHQVVLENYVIPGCLMVGTDSHTPNAGGLGAIAIGVGGADAAEVMAGFPFETTMPHLVGVRLIGRLKGWASSKDVAFEMLRRFTVKGGTGKIFEYFGPGAANLSATDKATIANMGAELGATTSVFLYDQSMDAYLRNVGRLHDADITKSIQESLTQDKECTKNPEKVFDEIVEIDLEKIIPSHAGPFSPDRVTEVRDFKFITKSENSEDISAVLLGSCTNSSYADLYSAAQVLKQGARHGLRPKVPLMLSPGSLQVYETIRRDGILDELLESGAIVLCASCGPCIGQWDRKDVDNGVSNCIFTTFNRNFKGRNDGNPETRAFLTSPAVAAALSISANAGFDPERDLLSGADGVKFKLEAPSPPALPEKGLVDTKTGFVAPPEDGCGIEIIMDPDSERLALLRPFDAWDGMDFVDLPVLVKTKGKTTTDHISPGGKWLRYRGHLAKISQNLLEGAVNAFTGETGAGVNAVTGERNIKFSELGVYYRENTGGFVIIGDENYGEGSSREHAAMCPRFMGAKAVIARSFARIHEANLKKQGILALHFLSYSDYDKIGEYDRVSIVGLSGLEPGKSLTALIKKKDNTVVEICLGHSLTEKQIEWFKAGSALNAMLQKVKM